VRFGALEFNFCQQQQQQYPFNALFPGLSKWAGRSNWSDRQWVAAASAGPYANLHLNPDR